MKLMGGIFKTVYVVNQKFKEIAGGWFNTFLISDSKQQLFYTFRPKHWVFPDRLMADSINSLLGLIDEDLPKSHRFLSNKLNSNELRDLSNYPVTSTTWHYNKWISIKFALKNTLFLIFEITNK